MQTKCLALDKNNLLLAAELLKKGQIIAFPTETVYGLGVHPENKEAIEALYSLKGRPKEKAFILHVSSLKDARRYILETPPLLDKLAKKFLPGPLSIIVKGVYQETIAIRMPAIDKVLEWIGYCGGAIFGTSANLSNEKPALSAKEVMELFMGKIPIVLDGGEPLWKIPSTIIDLTSTPRIVREGAIAKDLLFSSF